MIASRTGVWFRVMIGISLISMGGCLSSSPSPRLSVVLGLSGEKAIMQAGPQEPWADRDSLGLLIHSDATGPEAAPAISSSMLSRLSRRVQAYLGQHCGVSDLTDLSISENPRADRLSSLLSDAKQLGLESVLIAVFSSTETTEPGTFGEERMMTQIPGTTTHNSAFVELGLLDVAQGFVEGHVHGEATESMDRLNVPIGNDQLMAEEALDILRANAGQQALDDALSKITQGCVST